MFVPSLPAVAELTRMPISLCHMREAEQEVNLFCAGHCWREVLIQVIERRRANATHSLFTVA
jgi:hypothetical protein